MRRLPSGGALRAAWRSGWRGHRAGRLAASARAPQSPRSACTARRRCAALRMGRDADGRMHIRLPELSARERHPGGSMLYDAYEVQRSLLAGAPAGSPGSAPDGSTIRPIPSATARWGRWSPPALDVFAHASAPRGKPEFGLRDDADRRKSRFAVHEEIVLRKPFGQLKHFVRKGRRRRAQAADRRADVGPLCDAAARHGRADAARA